MLATADDGDELFYIGDLGREQGLAMLDGRGKPALLAPLSIRSPEPDTVFLALGRSTVWYAVAGEVWRIARSRTSPPEVVVGKPDAVPIADMLVDEDVAYLARGKTIARADNLADAIVTSDAPVTAFARLTAKRWAWCTGTELVVQR